MLYHSSPAESPTPTTDERRRGHRVEVLGQLHGFSVALRVPIEIRDIGSGGFSIETPVPFPDRSVHAFRFTTSTGTEIVLDAESVRSARLDRPGQPPVYVTGFQFLDDGPTTRAQVDDLAAQIGATITLG